MAADTTITDPPVDLRLMRLLQLVSPTLPVGAFAYSQGLEWAIETGWVADAKQAGQWIHGVLKNGQARLDIPVLARLYKAWQSRDMTTFAHWNRFLIAARGSFELQQEDRHMGQALHRLLCSLLPEQMQAMTCSGPSFTAMFAVAAANWDIGIETAGAGLLWAWAENQVAAAVKLVPLGQTQGQALLMQLAEKIPGAVKCALTLAAEEIGAAAPALSMAAMNHETQHTRLFRS